jgi:uncharacterized protein YjbJ (UPF0337 family)
MNSSQIKGKGEQTKGEIKEEVGHRTGNASTEAQGIKDQGRGKIRESYGSVKETVKRNVDDAFGNIKDEDPDPTRGPW